MKERGFLHHPTKRVGCLSARVRSIDRMVIHKALGEAAEAIEAVGQPPSSVLWTQTARPVKADLRCIG